MQYMQGNDDDGKSYTWIVCWSYEFIGGWSDQVVDSEDASGGESLDGTRSESSHEASYLTTPNIALIPA